MGHLWWLFFAALPPCRLAALFSHIISCWSLALARTRTRRTAGRLIAHSVKTRAQQCLMTRRTASHSCAPYRKHCHWRRWSEVGGCGAFWRALAAFGCAEERRVCCYRLVRAAASVVPRDAMQMCGVCRYNCRCVSSAAVRCVVRNSRTGRVAVSAVCPLERY